jgi:hypothetical protein
MDKKKLLSDSEIGSGIADLDPIIDNKVQKMEFRSYLIFNREKAALVNIVAEFKEEPFKVLNMRFDMASIRRKTSTLGSMNCWVWVAGGEEVVKTSKKKETKEMPPSWSESYQTIMIPESLKAVDIIVMDDDAEVGRLTLGMDKLLASNDEQSFNEEFFFEQKVNAGSLKFVTKTGTNPTFTEPRLSVAAPPIKEESPKKE